MKILFVCTGNTCRSAMAEGIMKDFIQKKGHDIEVISRGIYASNDNLATGESIDALRSLYKIDISNHRSSRLTFADIKSSDVIYAMTENHINLIHTTLEDDALFGKIKLFSNKDIDDPYMGSKKEYEMCAKLIYKGIKKILEEEM